MKQAYEKYNKAGLACLPTKADKSPDVKGTWLGGVSTGYENSHGIGIICGEVSGGLECLDFDNHFADAKQILSRYILIDEVKAIYDKYKLPIESTLSGGFHVLYRCDKIENNQKLAERLKDGRPDAIIETRGGNGYFVAAPTPKYNVIKNDILNIPKITEAERSVLIENARSFNEVCKQINTPQYSEDKRPGDKYNESLDSIEDMKNSLRRAGWKDNGMKWTRPGKESGVSATLGKVADNVFYTFSSNSHPFEPNSGYTPFQVVCLLDYNGDFNLFAKELAAKYGDIPSYKATEKVKKQKQTVSELDDILNDAYIDLDIPISRPPVCIKIRDRVNNYTKDKRLFTLGNFSAITGKGKSKKTFLSSLFLACACKNGIIQDKFIGEFPEGKSAVLLFDTEQGLYDAYNVSKRVLDIAGMKHPGFGSFALREYTPKERVNIIEHALKKWEKNIGLVVIDGIADLATAINDESIASETIGHLMRWTKQYNCHIIVIIHQNKNDEYATGHLGSSIIKKAEAVIKVSKSNSDFNVSHVECDLIRGVADFNPFDFKINENGLPIIDNNIQYNENSF